MQRWCQKHEHGFNNKEECQDCEREQNELEYQILYANDKVIE